MKGFIVMSNSVFKRCACSAVVVGDDGQPLRGTNGRVKRRDLSSSCPHLRRADGSWNPRHGTWFFHIDVSESGTGNRSQLRHGGYASREAAAAARDAVMALMAVAEDADNPSAARATIINLVRARLTSGEPLPDVEEVRARVKVGAPIETDITVEAWLRRWIAGKTDLRAATRMSYSGIIENYLVPALGHHRLDRLRPGLIKEAMNEIAATAESINAENEHRHRIVAVSKKAWREHDTATARAARAKLKELPPFRRPPNAATVQRIRGVLRAALTDACHEQLITVILRSW